MTAALEYLTQPTPSLGVCDLCEALCISRATLDRRQKRIGTPDTPNAPRPASHRVIPPAERQEILDVICREEFSNLNPRQIYARLRERELYYCSISTMHRILKENMAVKERRNQRRHPKRAVPRLTATAINQVWTWDITKIAGPCRGEFYYLYVAQDLFSRRIVAWTMQNHESGATAKLMFRTAIRRLEVDPERLTIHADRGAPMTSQDLYLLFEQLGITGSHSRPRVSDDNAYIESYFKTCKFSPGYPGRFKDIKAARAWFDAFITGYNQEHQHTGIALFTPDQVYTGRHVEIQKTRQGALTSAYAKTPERFGKGPPVPPQLPVEVHINPLPLSETTGAQVMNQRGGRAATKSKKNLAAAA